MHFPYCGRVGGVCRLGGRFSDIQFSSINLGHLGDPIGWIGLFQDCSSLPSWTGPRARPVWEPLTTHCTTPIVPPCFVLGRRAKKEKKREGDDEALGGPFGLPGTGTGPEPHIHSQPLRYWGSPHPLLMG